MRTADERKRLRDGYRDGLLLDTIPFWFPRSVDREHGGFLTCFDRDGSLLQTDKSVWFQGRFAWMLATLYNTVERKGEWLALARHGVEFIRERCFDTDGRMFFSLTQDGRPLRKRRYIFSEIFAIIALAAYGQAARDDRSKKEALDLFRRVLGYLETPGALPPKTDPEVRPMKGLAIPMCLLVTAQELRKVVPDPLLDKVIDRNIAEVENDFMKPEFRCVLETVGPKGEFLDNFDGRLVLPGHAIEVGWFILEEARLRDGNRRLIDIGTKIIDWSFEIGWDRECGGLYYFRDARGLPVTEYQQDMKFWWPHNEAIIGSLLAYQLTGEEKYARWHKAAHDWAHAHFADPVHGEWFGYLHRDGSIATALKGNMWKGFFHLPRMQWYCWQRLEEMGV
jgi:N-acylglucosamine 2-epimerase